MAIRLTILLASVLTANSLMAMWVAHTHRDWIFRVLIHIAVITLLLLIPAHSAIAMLLAQSAVIFLPNAIGHWRASNLKISLADSMGCVVVACWLSFVCSRLIHGTETVDWSAAGIAGGASGLLAWLTQIAFRAKRRHLLLRVGMIVVLLGLMTVGANAYFGPITSSGFDGSSTMTYLFCGTVLMLVVASVVGWEFIGEERWWARPAQALMLLLVALPTIYYGCRLYIPNPEQPNNVPDPNGYELLTEMGLQLDGKWSHSWTEVTVDELEAGLKDHKSVFDRIASALAAESSVPVIYQADEIDVEAFQALRSAGRALAARGYFYEQEGRHQEAASDYLAILDVGDRASRGGLLVHALVGLAIESLGQQSLHKVVDQLDEAACLEVIRKIERHAKRREPVTETQRREKAWSQQAFGYLGHLTSILETDLGNSDALFGLEMSGDLWYAKNVTRQNLLLTTLGLRVYKLRNGQLPDTLAELVPEILPEIPEDALAPSNAPLRYVVGR